MPGFTHLQVAQPVTFAHHLLAYVEMFARDAERLAEVRARTNRLPLGAAALAGTSYPLDREARRQGARLGRRLPEQHRRRQRPRLRDRVHAGGEPVHGARLAPQRGARALDEPELRLRRARRPLHAPARRSCRRRRTPTCAELARGKTGRVVGHLMGLLTLMKGQPLAYNKDNQEDKEPLFDTVDTLKDTLRIFAEMVPGIAVKAEAMERAAAARLRDRDRPRRLPGEEGRALPRRARGGGARGQARDRRRASTSPSCRSTTLQGFHPAIGADVHDVLTLRGSLASRNVAGRHRARAGAGADRAPPRAPRGAGGLQPRLHPAGRCRVSRALTRRPRSRSAVAGSPSPPSPPARR